MNDDPALLRRHVEERSEEAFAELVRRHLPLVYSAALRQLNGATHRAEEVTQSVFADLARKAASLTRRDELAGWLYTSTHFAAAKLKRAEQRRQAREREAHLMHEILSGSAAATEWERLRPVLDDAMHELGDRDREIILLRFFQDGRFADVGAKLGMSEDAARMRVERALDKLRASLGRRQITSTTAALAFALANQPAMAVSPVFAASVTGSALAAAGAVVTGPAGALVSFMSTSKIAAGVAGVVLIVAFGGAAREVYASRKTEVALADARQQHDALSARMQTLQQQADAAEREAVDLKQKIAAVRPAPAASPRTTTPSPRTAPDPAATAAFMARHPEIQRLAAEQWRARAKADYGRLFKELGLSPAQIESFADLMTQGVSGTVTVPSGERVGYAAGGDHAAAQRQLRDLLGEDGFRRYQEFDAKQTPALQLTTELSGALFDTAAPLTAEQGEQLRQILTENRVTVAGSPRPRYDWDAIMPKAESVLSAVQLDMLARYRASDESDQASIQVARRALPTAASGNAVVNPGK